MSEAEFAALTEEQYADLVEALAEDSTLDPLEEMVRDLFLVHATIRGAFGPYFDWNPEVHGIPYVTVVPVGGMVNYVMPQALKNARARTAMDHDTRQITIHSTDRGLTLAIAAAISTRLEAVHNLPMKQNQHCSQILQRMRWHTVFVQAKDSLLNVNCWQTFSRFEFVVQRDAGA